MAEELIQLDAGDRRFPSASKDLIVANRSFRFIVRGEAAAVLMEFIVNGRMIDAYKLPGRHRQLTGVMGATLLAEGMGRGVTFARSGSDVIGTVQSSDG